MALVHVAWQMSYEEVVDYFRSHSQAAQAAGFPEGRVIGVSQYWERRRVLGIGPFWFFFVAMVWQLLRLGVIKGAEVILDGTTLRIWFHKDPEAGWSFPKPWKGSVWGYKVHTLLCRWSQLPILFLITGQALLWLGVGALVWLGSCLSTYCFGLCCYARCGFDGSSFTTA